MNPPKIPIHIGDFLRDTGHLRAALIGAYLLLLMHHWSTGGLPDDDDQLSAIARMSPAEWKKAKPIIEKFFKPGWRHGRVEEDLEAAKQSYEKRAKAGAEGGKAKAATKQSSSNATAEPEQPLTFNHLPKKDSEPNGSGAEAPPDPSDPERQLFVRGRELLGKESGGQIAKMLKACGGNVSLARSKLELAATKDKPAGFVAGIIRAGPLPTAKPLTAHQRERETGREILDDLEQFVSSSGGQTDPRLLRHDPGNGSAGVHGGIRRDVIVVPATRVGKGGESV